MAVKETVEVKIPEMLEKPEITTARHVIRSINEITSELGKKGISKDRKNQQQNYAFRGIDDVYEALNPMLAKHKLVITPHVLKRHVTERDTKSGGVMFYVALEIEYQFISAVDDSSHTIEVYGEAMDSADKATNKAMSAAYKSMCLQVFCIPTESGSPDADENTHEVIRQPSPPPSLPPEVQQVRDLEKSIREAKTAEDVAMLLDKEAGLLHRIPKNVYDSIVSAAGIRQNELAAKGVANA